MNSKENFADLNGTKLVNKINDLVIGEDSNDYLTVNSETRFHSDVNVGGSSIRLHSSDNTNSNNFISILDQNIHSVHAQTLREIQDLRITNNNGKYLKFDDSGLIASTISGGGGASGIKILANTTLTSSSSVSEIELDAGTNYNTYEFFSLEMIGVTGDSNGYIIFQPVLQSNGTLDTNHVNSKWTTTNTTDDENNLISTKTVQTNHLLGFHTKGAQHIETKIYSLNENTTKIFSTFKSIGIHTNSGDETFLQSGTTTSNSTTSECNKIKIKLFKLDGSYGNLTGGTFLLYGHSKIANQDISATDLPTPTISNIGKTLQVNASGNGYEFSNGASLDGSIILGSQTASASSHIELDAGASYSDYEYFTIIGIDIVCSNNGYIAWKGVKASDNSILSTTTNNKWQVTNLTDSDEEGTFHTQQNYHVLGYHTKGSQNIKVKIFGLHNGGGTQKKYSMFKNIGTHQNAGTETNYQEGTSSQNKNDNDDNCRKIRIYNYDLTGSAGTITSGKFILYGHRNVAITNNTILPVPTLSNAGKTMVVNSTGTGYDFNTPSATTNTISAISTNSSFRIPIINDASGTTNTLNVPISDQLRVNPSNGNVSIGSNTPTGTHKLFINGNTKLGDTSSHTTTITKANITDATITDATITDATVTNATVTNLTVSGGSTGQILSKSSSGKLEYINPPTIKEYISEFCNGQTITTKSGTSLTFQNVTGPQYSSDTITEITGSTVTYLPPSGTTTVIYEFHFQYGRNDHHALNAFRFYINNVEQTRAKSAFGGDENEDKVIIKVPIKITGTTSTTLCTLDNWNSAKTLSVKFRTHNSSHDITIHTSEWWEGSDVSDTANLMTPVITLIAIQ